MNWMMLGFKVWTTADVEASSAAACEPRLKPGAPGSLTTGAPWSVVGTTWVPTRILGKSSRISPMCQLLGKVNR